jgi:hypothetical protein
MTGYELSRNWFDWCFENPEKINPNHTALYFFICEHSNRMGGKSKFGLPTTMAKDAIGIRSYNTYIKTLNDLVEFGFIELIERSKNQYSSNIIALSNFNKAHNKALDKAMIKHTTKQVESTIQSIDSIDKPIKIEPIKDNVFSFNEFWELYPNKTAKAKCKPKFDKLTNSEKEQIKNTINKFLSYKPFPNYNHPNPETYLNQKRWEDVIPEPKQETEVSELDAINEARQNWIKKNMG